MGKKRPPENRSKENSSLRQVASHGLVVLFSLIALTTFFTPIQHYVTLARFQHWGIAIGIFGAGCALQALAARNLLTTWVRNSYLTTGLYFLFIGSTYYLNPWLDNKVSIQTSENETTRVFLIISYILFGLVVAAVWINLLLERSRPESKAESGKDRQRR